MRALESSIECDAPRLTMAINMKELASVNCIVKEIKFFGGINSFTSFDDLHSLTMLNVQQIYFQHSLQVNTKMLMNTLCV